MGFWSGLGKVLGGAASFIPGVGPIASNIIGAAGNAIGAMGDQAAQNRGEADRMNLSRDQLRLQDASNFERALMDRQLLDLKRRDETRNESKDAYVMALKSALAKNMGDVSFDRSGFKTPVANIRFSGGARPSALGVEGREAAAVMNNQALQRLMNPQGFSDVPAPERMKFSEPEKKSIWEKIAGPVGMGLSVVGAATRPGAAAQRPVQQPLPAVQDDYVSRLLGEQ